jgi:hypothetical protein
MLILHQLFVISMVKKRKLDTMVTGAVINAALFFHIKELIGLYGSHDPLLWKI